MWGSESFGVFVSDIELSQTEDSRSSIREVELSTRVEVTLAVSTFSSSTTVDAITEVEHDLLPLLPSYFSVADRVRRIDGGVDSICVPALSFASSDFRLRLGFGKDAESSCAA